MSGLSSQLSSPSVDEREVEFYRNLADTWWDVKGPFWPLHQLNLLRVGWITQQLHLSSLTRAQGARSLTGLKVLDVGCGGGILAEALAKLGADVLGIDMVERNIQVATAHAPTVALTSGMK